jgi:hypothetical protein
MPAPSNAVTNGTWGAVFQGWYYTAMTEVCSGQHTCSQSKVDLEYSSGFASYEDCLNYITLPPCGS